MISQPRKFRKICSLAGACCLAGLASPGLPAAEAPQQVAVAQMAVARAVAARPAPAPAAGGLGSYRLPSESPRIRRPLELKLAPAPVHLTKSLQNAPAMKRPPESESQNALKGHGTADFPDGDIEYKWQIKGSKLKVMIPF